MSEHEKIDYVEFPSKNIEITKSFFSAVFDWEFTDYGPDYIGFRNQGLSGGFVTSDDVCLSDKGSALLVFYSADIASTQLKIEKAGGLIVKPLFSFPGGRRFHFADPNGNEYAVWSDK